jgi:putative peptidoglycan lipid II flippase
VTIQLTARRTPSPRSPHQIPCEYRGIDLFRRNHLSFTAWRVMAQAAQNRVLRGGLVIGGGLLAGNLLGFLRVMFTAYLLGTGSHADALVVAIGSLDALNWIIINTMVFAFVPMLTARDGMGRAALFFELNRRFSRVFLALTIVLLVFAPWLVRLLAPGLEPAYYADAVRLFRIGSFSTAAAGLAAMRSALLYSNQRFAVPAFYQASVNLFTLAGAFLLWRIAGIYGFALGYAVGSWVQLSILCVASRPHLVSADGPLPRLEWRDLIGEPASFLLYSGGLALNITLTRAYATDVGPGMAAALEYCIRCIGVPLALIVNPISGSLLPEVARLRNQAQMQKALRLIDRSLGLAAVTVVVGCAAELFFREPMFALLFQRGSFTAASSSLVASVFLGLGPSLIGWSLMDLVARSLFALGRPWLPVCAACIPVTLNAAITLVFQSREPQFLGLGASVGLTVGFCFLAILIHTRRRNWLLIAQRRHERTLSVSAQACSQG